MNQPTTRSLARSLTHSRTMSSLVPLAWTPESHGQATPIVQRVVYTVLLLRGSGAAPVLLNIPNELLFTIFEFL